MFKLFFISLCLFSSQLTLASEECLEHVGKCRFISTDIVLLDPDQPISRVEYRSTAKFISRYKRDVLHTLYETERHSDQYVEYEASPDLWLGYWRTFYYSDVCNYERKTPLMTYWEIKKWGMNHFASAQDKTKKKSKKLAIKTCNLERQFLVDFYSLCEE